MTFLLDTSVVSALMREDARVAQWLSNLSPDDQILICTIVQGEILFGLEKLVQGRRRADLNAKAQNLFAMIPCESIPAEAAAAYARLKASQQRSGLSLDDNDPWIAATALALGATIVSSDRDFGRLQAVAVVSP